MIYVDIHGHKLSFDESVDGIKKMFKYFPALESVVLQANDMTEAVDFVLEYLNSHHMEAWIDRNDLKKSPPEVDEGFFPNVNVNKKVYSDHFKTYKLKNNLYHHVFKDEGFNEVNHVLSTDANPSKADKYIAKISGNEIAFTGKKYHNGAMPFQIESSAVHDKLLGRGFGKKLYEAVLGHHGHIVSDSHLSPGSNRVYTEHFNDMPYVLTELAPENDEYQYHEVRVTHPEEYNDEIYDTLKKSIGAKYESYWSNRVFGSEQEAKEAFVRNINLNNKQFGAFFGHSDPNEELKHIKIVPHRGKFKIKSAIAEKKPKKQYSYNTDKDLISEQKNKYISNIGMPMDSVFSSATIPIHEIHPTEEINHDKVARLAQHIKSGGELPPILLDGGYGVLDGHHRLEAAKRLKIKEVPVVFLHNPDEDDIPHLKKTKETSGVQFSWRNAKNYIDQAHAEGAKTTTNKLGVLPDKSLNIYGHTINSPANGRPVYHHIISDKNSTIHTLSLSEDPKEYPISYMHVEHYENFPDWKGVPTVKLSYSGENSGFGFGTLLYKQALKHHGKLQSDSITSKGADKAWKKLLSMPKVRGKLGVAGDSESRHIAELQKGTFQRKHPYNPQKEPFEVRDPTERWTSGYFDTSRNEVPRMSDNALLRGMHKLHSLTRVRRNPQTGEREFQLFRGMTVADFVKDGVYGISSFTAKPAIAASFNSDARNDIRADPQRISEHQEALYNMENNERDEFIKENYGKIIESWVPESAIHSIPNAIGSTSHYLGMPPTLGAVPSKGQRHEEHEVVVDFDKIPKRNNTIHNWYDFENKFVKQPSDLKDRLVSKFGERLKKGSFHRKHPYNPKHDIGPGEFEPLRVWANVGVGSERENIKPLPENAKARLLHKLSGQTKVKIMDGKRHFLLHRGMSEREMNNHHMGDFVDYSGTTPYFKTNSWTPDHRVAYQFGNGRVASAWVHEDDIINSPIMHWNISKRLKGEKEYIVRHTRPHPALNDEEALKLSIPHSSYKVGETSIKVFDKDNYLVERDMANIHHKINQKLSKAFSYKGTIRPEHSDPDGMKHPEKPYIKGTSRHGPAWYYSDDIAKKHEHKFMDSFNKFLPSLSQQGRQHLYSLGRMIAHDADRHAIATGTPDGGQELRLRHVVAAMSNTPGYSIKEVPTGLEITAARHSGDKEKAGESHTWHFNGKDLKFLPKMPISKSNGGAYELGRADRRAKEAGRGHSYSERGYGRSGQADLSKALPQIKAPYLLPDNQRPEQDVYRVSSGPSSKASVRRLKTAYGTESRSLVGEITKDPTVGIHDPYSTKISLASTKAPESVIAHEAHHRTVSKLVDQYGIDKVHNLYNNIIKQIPKPLFDLFDEVLLNSQNYAHLKNTKDQRQNLVYKEEIINLIRDVATGQERRNTFKDFYAKHNNNAPIPHFQQWEKLDNTVKKTWKNITNFANSVKKEHL